MKKGSGTKKRISVTLDNELVNDLSNKCEEKTMKLSNYIEKLIKLGLKYEK